MDDVFCFQVVSFGNLGFAGFTSIQRTAFFQKFTTSRLMNCTIYTSTPKETAVGCVDNTFNISLRNIRSADINDVFSFFRRNSCIENGSDVGLRKIERQIPGIQHNALNARIH